MQSTFRNGLYAGIVVAAALGLWLAQLWQEENQVRLHSEHLLRKIEARNWAGAGDYRDDWGDDRARLLDRLRLVLRSFSSLTITATNPQVRLDPPTGNWSAKIQIGGTGGEFAPEIIARVNSLTKPFELHWRRESWKPWDWKLIGVSNPSLEISGEIF